MTRRYGYETFTAEVNGETYTFDAYTTNTQTGFCHHVECREIGIKARIGYCNRTWESFTYQTCLRECIDKLKRKSDKPLHDELVRILIDRKEKEVHEECEKFTKAFQTAWEDAGEKGREMVKKAVGDKMIETEEEAHAVLGLLQLAAIMK